MDASADFSRVTVTLNTAGGAVLGEGLLVYPRGVILLPDAVRKFKVKGKTGDALSCTWTDSTTAATEPFAGTGENASPAVGSDQLVGVNLAADAPPARQKNLPFPATPPSSTDKYAALLIALINGAAPEDPDGVDVGGKKPPWCWLFPGCPGCK